MPRMSVIIPTLNEEAFLPRMLHGLSKQTFKDFEVIVVDGGSTDKTAKIAKEFGVRFFQIRKKGCPVARNFGAQKAKSDILVMTDADVVHPPTWLENFYKDLHQYDADLVWGPTTFSEKTHLPLALGFSFGWVLQKRFGKRMPIVSNPNFAIKREAFQKIGGYREDLRLLDDYDLGLRARRNLNVHFNHKNRVSLSTRRFPTYLALLIELKKYTRALTQYHLTGSTTVVQEAFKPA